MNTHHEMNFSNISKYDTNRKNDSFMQGPISCLKLNIYISGIVIVGVVVYFAIINTMKYKELNIKDRLLLKELNTLQVEQHDNNDKLTTLIQKKDSTSKKIESLTQSISRLVAEKEALAKTIDSNEGNNQRLNNQLQTLIEKNVELKKQRDIFDQDKLNKDEMISEYLKQISSLQKSIKEEKSKDIEENTE